MIPQALPLEPVEPLPMQEAYRLCGISHRLTYEQAMTRPALAIAIRLHAEVIARERKEK